MKTLRNLVLSLMFACPTITGCANSSAIEERHLENVHKLLGQGEWNG